MALALAAVVSCALVVGGGGGAEAEGRVNERDVIGRIVSERAPMSPQATCTRCKWAVAACACGSLRDHLIAAHEQSRFQFQEMSFWHRPKRLPPRTLFVVIVIILIN